MMRHTFSPAFLATAAVADAQSAHAGASDGAGTIRFAASTGTRQGLSPREVLIVDLIGNGQSNKEIARLLRITPETVKTHVKNIFLKLGVERRAQAVLRAHTLGLIAGDASISVDRAAL